MGYETSRAWREMLSRSFSPRQWWDEDGEVDWTEEPHGGVSLDGSVEADVMWVYRRVAGGWEVGYWDPDKQWFCESLHRTVSLAAQRVHFLNGGGMV